MALEDDDLRAVGVLRRPIAGSPTAFTGMNVGYAPARPGEEAAAASMPAARTYEAQQADWAARSRAAAEAQYPTAVAPAVAAATPAYISQADIARERASPFMSGRGGGSAPAVASPADVEANYKRYRTSSTADQPYPNLEGGRFSSYYSGGGGYGGSVTPQFPSASSMRDMVPQDVQDMIAQQANRVNFLRAGGAGWLGQLGAGHAQQRLLAMQELANRFMGTGIQGGQLGVAQGELGVKRGMLDVEHGKLGLGWAQHGLQRDIHQPGIDLDTLRNRYIGEGRLDETGAMVRAAGGKTPYDLTTIQGPWETTFIPTRKLAQGGRVPLTPAVQPGGAGDTKKPFGGMTIAPPVLNADPRSMGFVDPRDRVSYTAR